MPKNVALKIAIVESGLSQADVAARIEMHDTKLSMIVNGRRDASEVEQQEIVRVLNAARHKRKLPALRPAQLFPQQAIAS